MSEEATGTIKGPEKKAKTDIGNYLTEEERRKLLASLHRSLIWVGVKEPEECKFDKETMKKEMTKYCQTEKDLPPEVHSNKGTIEVHHLIWRLINEKEITEKERVQIEELIDILGKKEKQAEEKLAHEKLTRQQANELYNKTASCLRALVDLKDLLRKREHCELDEEAVRRKVEDVKRWTKFTDQFKEECR